MGRRPKAWGPPRHGILLVDKPLGMGSTQVVSRVRHAVQGNRTGHAGTLDPLATGVLVCCVGRATKCVEEIMASEKVYHATIDLSGFTATDDAELPPEPVTVAEPPDRARLSRVLDGLTGTIEQVPSVYSALKVGGKPAYERVRAGETVVLASRRVRIDTIDLEAYDWPLATITVTCGRGTYIRSLARQIGEALGTGGFLRSLRRLRVGVYRVADAWCLEDLPEELLEADLLPVPEAAAVPRSDLPADPTG